ncbi:hypothetical protein FQZ97_729520 [compost metagenome]
MTEVAQGIARALEGVFGVRQQVVDLRHQRFQLARHAAVQRAALALLQLGDLLAHLIQRTQCTVDGQALQQQDQEQGRHPQAQAHLPYAAKALQHRRVILGHED